MKLVRHIEVLDGPGQGQRHELFRDETILGRSVNAHIRFEDMEVSRLHCKVILSGDEVILEDQGSTHGTQLNGRRVHRETIKSGDVIKIGNTRLQLLTTDEGHVNPGEDEPEKSAAEGKKPRLPRPRLSWPAKVFLLLLALVLASLPVMVLPIYFQARQDLAEAALGRYKALALALAVANTEALGKGERLKVSTALVMEERGVMQVYVHDMEGRILHPVSKMQQLPDDEVGRRAVAAQRMEVQDLGGYQYDVAVPVRALSQETGEFQKVGTARLVVSLGDSVMKSLAAWWLIALCLAAYMLLAGLAAWLVVRLTRGALVHLRDQCEGVIKGDRRDVEPLASLPGVSALAETLNRLIAKGPAAVQPARPAAPAAPPSNRETAMAKSLAEVSLEPLAVVDGEYKIVMANQAFLAWRGLDRRQVVGAFLVDVINDHPMMPGLMDLFKKASEAGGKPVWADLDNGDGPIPVTVAMSASQGCTFMAFHPAGSPGDAGGRP